MGAHYLHMGIMITYHGYNNGFNNPVYNVHTKTWVHIITGSALYIARYHFNMLIEIIICLIQYTPSIIISVYH